VASVFPSVADREHRSLTERALRERVRRGVFLAGSALTIDAVLAAPGHVTCHCLPQQAPSPPRFSGMSIGNPSRDFFLVRLAEDALLPAAAEGHVSLLVLSTTPLPASVEGCLATAP
jgi:hypothetical protein